MARPVEYSSGYPSEFTSATTATGPTVQTTSTFLPQPSAPDNIPPTSSTSFFASIFADPPSQHTEFPLNERRDSVTFDQSNVSLPQRKTRDYREHREPPKREVESSHHHHHVIPVDSETDFVKMHVDERKVNYLPYNPPVAISQTGLIQSIGRPFSHNHAKHLPDPGDEFKLTRRVSQVKLEQVTILGDVNPKVVHGLAATLRMFSILIGVGGLILFCFVLAVSSGSTPMEYPLYFLDNNPLCKAVNIAGAVQPMAVAPYCRYALINLRHIRGYFLRVPLSLGIPVGVTLCGLVQFTGTVTNKGEMRKFLRERMSHYFRDTYITPYAKITWDGVQDSFNCCGYDGPTDWKKYNNSVYPRSCCKKSKSSCTQSSTDLKTKGCKSSYKGSNITIALTYFVVGIAIVVVEVLSVVFMRSLYACIGKEVYDERSSSYIMCGKICSLCDIEDTDEELEYDEVVVHEHHNSSDDSGNEDKAHKRQPPIKSVALDSTTSEQKLPPSAATSTHSVVSSTRDSAGRGIGRGRGRGRGRGTNKVAPAPP